MFYGSKDIEGDDDGIVYLKHLKAFLTTSQMIVLFESTDFQGL